jgi:hypothetical protein
VALGTGDDGSLYASVASSGAPGEVTVALSARGEGDVVSTMRTVVVPDTGFGRVVWTVAEGFPAGAREASARLTGDDALPTDDQAFAVRSPAPLRRVGVVGKAPPGVLRALEAVPGARVEHLAALPPLAAQDGFDLLVTTAVPDALPATALFVLLSGTAKGGVLRVTSDRSLLPHALAALGREPAVAVDPVAPSPRRWGSLTTVLSAGEAPLLKVGGEGRRLVAMLFGPLRVDRPSWPVLWAEVLAQAAPRTRSHLRAHTAGTAWPAGLGLGPAPWHVKRYRNSAGLAVAGTAAAPLPSRSGTAAPRVFSAEDLGRIEAIRGPAPLTPLAPPLAVIGLVLLLGAWWRPG